MTSFLNDSSFYSSLIDYFDLKSASLPERSKNPWPKKSEKTREINFEMNDQEFSNYLEQLKADHATKMAALEDETAPLRKPVKKLDEKIAKEWFLRLA